MVRILPSAPISRVRILSALQKAQQAERELLSQEVLMYALLENGRVVLATGNAELVVKIASAFKKRMPEKTFRVEWRN